MAVKYPPIELVKSIHANQIRQYGGIFGLRDPGLLESALAQPRRSVGGKLIHKTIFDKAAAYGFHLCKNHPFVDGNKRVAFIIMYIFMANNNWIINASEESAYSMMMELAEGKLSKRRLSAWLQKNSHKSLK
ncbi:MAG TPA: type II toxin-antitoxin system death-on-curing family toxin [bacterium]|nr:type II toxin-antitoxin system death-on-curing family toxin [bacterium]HMW36973.1 type II toxin-antitoxin system death-on-curing family toxin [bacterium]HNB11117.1 type II toxin-antitoxin system death-on-curing family toxin [bacterium]HNE85291.1 type II toxin-antitoxin system death-on-curing family toxin [bacterium]HNH34203.1 type II toxin-antitoxin system death-on-curing family toxin [bacterium]